MPGDQDTGREGFLEEGHEGQGSPEKAAWLRAWPRRHLGSRAAAEMVPWAERMIFVFVAKAFYHPNFASSSSTT